MSLCPHGITRLHWTDFDEIWYLCFENLPKKIQFLLRSDKNDGHFTWKSFHIYDSISLIFFFKWDVWNKRCRESQNTYFMISKIFPGNRAVYEIMSKIWWSQRGRKWQYGAYALHAGLIRLHARKHTPAPCTHAHTHTHTDVCNTAFPRQRWFRERACYVIRTSAVLFLSTNCSTVSRARDI